MLKKVKLLFLLYAVLFISIIFVLDKTLNFSIYFSFFVSSLLSLLLVEILFRFYEFFISKRPLTYHRQRYADLYIESHPYLPYKYKNNCVIPASETHYPLKVFSYTFPEIKLNERGEISNQEKNVSINRARKFKVIMIGDSTVENHLKREGVVYSIPTLLEKRLNNNCFDTTFEVINSGIGGATAAHTLVKLALDDVFKEPDLIIFQFGYANTRSFFYEQYKPDESHFRKGVDAFERIIKITQKLPDFNLSILRFLIQKYLPTNIKKDLLKFVSKEGFDISLEPKGLEFFEKKILSLMGICKSHRIPFVLSTFSHFLYEDILDNSAHIKFNSIAKKINGIIKNFAKDHNLPIVDLDGCIEKNKDNFVDEAHYSHLGMQSAAEHYAILIEKLLKADRLAEGQSPAL